MQPSRIGPVVKSATADATGRAAVEFTGPGGSWRTLVVESITLSGTSTALPTARLYRGPRDSLGVLLATERDGNAGAFARTGDADTIAAGESWSIVWTGCTVGAVMSASLTGTERDR